jgi:hypothetical protein
MQLILARPRSSFGLTETSAHGNIRLVLARPRSSFGLAESSLFNNYFYNNACTRLRCHFLLANRDIYVWQHMACLGPPKKLIKIKCRASSSPPSGQPRHLRMATNDLSWPAQGIDHPTWRTSSSIPSGQPWHFSQVNMWILMVRPRIRLKLPSRFISPLLIDFQTPSYTSSTTPFTGLRLVLRP